ncbi:MAG: DUF3857 domain-containing protein [Desulfosalsimonadaceae bacterium]|nr:DUF3857 domain-containing protein [Desulfosalsimonadaceae bacterium]
MKQQGNQKRIIFVLACVACLQSAQSFAVTTIVQQKEMVIDSKWKTKGRYTSEFLVETPQGAEDTKLYLDHLAERPDKFQQLEITVLLPDGRRRNWNSGDNSLPVGSTVHVAYSVSAAFPGFEGLFADYFSTGQVRPIKQVSYRIRFPEKVRFQYRLEQGEKQFESLQEADHFEWSASQVRRLDLMITTARSWEQINDRYQSLYEKQYGKGLPPADIPNSLPAMDADSSVQKVIAVQAFLKNNFAYRSCSELEHSLIPNDPPTVIKRGWGDCKDMNMLGVALLSGMGVDAFILLTGTPRDNRWVHQLPDPFIFSHAVLGVGTGGETHYYDYQVPGREAAIKGKSSLRINIPALKNRRQ